ncbi:MAG: hypothetical protein K5989_02465 [Lachnospiraceae bacterium]|nr:hypothetical protein [Lachnospiraceae bacterium]
MKKKDFRTVALIVIGGLLVILLTWFVISFSASKENASGKGASAGTAKEGTVAESGSVGKGTSKGDSSKGTSGGEDAPESDEAAAAAEEEAIEGHNSIAVASRAYTGLQNLKNENYEDGTYYYQDLTGDGMVVITNLSTAASEDRDDTEAYIKSFITEKIEKDANIKKVESNSNISARLTYPSYVVEWESGKNEDSRDAIGLVFFSDGFTYYYGYSCPLDAYEDNEAFFREELEGIELTEE